MFHFQVTFNVHLFTNSDDLNVRIFAMSSFETVVQVYSRFEQRVTIFETCDLVYTSPYQSCEGVSVTSRCR